MIRLIAARVGQAGLALVGMSLLIWGLLLLTPGDPAERTLSGRGRGAPPEPAQIAALRHDLGLDRPWFVQYGSWATGFVQGRLGRSYLSGQPIEREIGQRLGATLILTAGAVVVAIGLALPAAVIAARFVNRPPDHATRLLALFGRSMPSFWLGLLLLDLFAVRWGWTSALAKPDLAHLPLPAFTLGIGLAATLSRLLRAGLLDELGRRYALLARARGAGVWRVLLRHALPNAALPSLNALALGVGALLGGAAVVETVFTWPGLGLYILEAITTRDLPVIQAFAMISAAIFIGVNLLTDLLTIVIDPRLRHQLS